MVNGLWGLFLKTFQKPLSYEEEIYYIKNGERFDARALDIDEKGGLIVEKCDGTKVTLNSGEITLRIKPE